MGWGGMGLRWRWTGAHIQTDLRGRQQVPQLTLDDGSLILRATPDVRQEEVVVLPGMQLKLVLGRMIRLGQEDTLHV